VSSLKLAAAVVHTAAMMSEWMEWSGVCKVEGDNGTKEGKTNKSRAGPRAIDSSEDMFWYRGKWRVC
jgi:hypothetical protein